MKIDKIVVSVLLSCLSFFSISTAAHALKTLVIINNNGNQSTAPFRLVTSNPRNWQTLDNPPTTITLTFSGAPQLDRSFIKLYNLNGDELDAGPLVVQGANLSTIVNDLTVGKYVIKWRSRCQCDDNNELNDTIRFTIR